MHDITDVMAYMTCECAPEQYTVYAKYGNAQEAIGYIRIRNDKVQVMTAHEPVNEIGMKEELVLDFPIAGFKACGYLEFSGGSARDDKRAELINYCIGLIVGYRAGCPGPEIAEEQQS